MEVNATIIAMICCVNTQEHENNGMGWVDFVDSGYDRDKHEKYWSGIEFWKKEVQTKHFARIGISGYIKNST